MTFPKLKRLHWRKRKALAMLANRRQHNRLTIPTYSPEIEIQAENGFYLLSETGHYIITE